MKLITHDWRLKLLALGLAVLMLGAVAFSQNPPTSKEIQVGIAYTVPAGLMLINPPTRTTVTVSGLADLVSAANSSNTTTAADISKLNPGTGVRVNLVPKTTVLGFISVQTTPVVLNIDQRAVVKLPVTARAPKGTAPGWEITKMEARCPSAPCGVTFDGPVSKETNLKAYADFPVPVDGSYDFPSQTVVLEQNGTTLDFRNLVNNTQPEASLDISAVNIHIEAKSATTSRQVTLIDAPPVHLPPTCYRVTNVVVDPLTVVVVGAPDALAKITAITLPAVDLSRETADATFRVTVTYPDGVGGSAGTARVTYSISKNPNCSPAPSP